MLSAGSFLQFSPENLTFHVITNGTRLKKLSGSSDYQTVFMNKFVWEQAVFSVKLVTVTNVGIMIGVVKNAPSMTVGILQNYGWYFKMNGELFAKGIKYNQTGTFYVAPTIVTVQVDILNKIIQYKVNGISTGFIHYMSITDSDMLLLRPTVYIVNLNDVLDIVP